MAFQKQNIDDYIYMYSDIDDNTIIIDAYT